MTRFHTSIGLRYIALCAALLLLPALHASAQTTGPQKIVYDAHLLDSSGNAITAEHSVRFSWWTSADHVSGDTTATGAINMGASTYASWNEVHTVTPNSDGYFSVEMGSGTALPDLSSYTPSQLQSLFLQVEVKVSSAADTSYELLDQNASDSTVDRSPIDTVPFALNADMLDQRSTGTSSGSIPVLQSGGLLGLGLIPSGTNRDEFTLDADSSASDAITLQFGTSLAKTLVYDQSNTRFNFNDDVRVQGNLTVTGSVTVGNFALGTGTGAGTIRWTGTDFEGFNGSAWLSLTGTGTAAISQSDADARYVNKSGDTMTGNLIIASGASLSVSGAILTNGNLTINSDNEGVNAVLSFGNDAAVETLMFNDTNNRFEFSDDVYIAGSLTTTGLINGIDITTLGSSTDTHLKVASGGGLTVSVAAGSYRINSVITNYGGSGSVGLSDETTTYLYLTSTGLTLDTIAVPTDKSYIPLASVVTSAGGVSSISDLRTLNSDDRERTIQRVLHPQYANAALQGDGSNNVGKLYVNHDSSSKNNYYLWTSTITSLQDYDIVVRVPIPPDFKQWTRNPLSVTYRTTSGGSLDNKMDITVLDTGGSSVTLSGSTTDLVNTSWTTTTIDFQGSPTWTTEQDFLITFKMYAKSDYEMHLGALKLKYVEFQSSP